MINPASLAHLVTVPSRWAARFLALVLMAVFLAACGGGGGGGDSGAVGSSPPPPPPPLPPPPLPEPTASIPIGMPALYISTSEDASVFNDIIGDFIEGSTQSFIQFVPATGEAALLSTNSSVSFASDTGWLKAFDDNLYILVNSETSASVGRPDRDNLLDVLLGIGGSIPTPRQQESADEGCFTVLGDDLYYKVSWRDAPFPGTGFEDAEMVRVDDFFAASAGRDVDILDPGIGGDSPTPGGFITDACYFNVDVADGVWYDTKIDFALGEASFYTRDPETGEGSFVAGIVGLDTILDTYRISNYAFDERMVYFAFLNTDTQEVEILRQLLFDDFAIETVLPATVIDGLDVTGISQLDVDDGYVTFALEFGTGNAVALYDPNTGLLDVMDLGVRINQLALIYREP